MDFDDADEDDPWFVEAIKVLIMFFFLGAMATIAIAFWPDWLIWSGIFIGLGFVVRLAIAALYWISVGIYRGTQLLFGGKK